MSIISATQSMTSLILVAGTVSYLCKCGYRVWHYHKYYKDYYAKNLNVIFRSQTHWTGLVRGNVLDVAARNIVLLFGTRLRGRAKQFAHQIYIARCVIDLLRHLLLVIPKRWNELSEAYYGLGQAALEEADMEALFRSNNDVISSSVKLRWKIFYRRVTKIALACLRLFASFLELVMLTWNALDAFSSKYQEISFQHMVQNSVAFYEGVGETLAVIKEKMEQSALEKNIRSHFMAFFIGKLVKIESGGRVKQVFQKWLNVRQGNSIAV